VPRLPKGPVRGSVVFLFIVTNTLVIGVPLLVLALARLAIPLAGWRRWTGRVLIRMAEGWVAANSVMLRITQPTVWDVRGLEGLNPDGWYLVIANHRSWVDILAMQATLNRRVPFLKFFIKDQLRWIPVLGLAWWALDMPFMKRYSREQLARRPELRGKDMEATLKACEKFRDLPTSVMNFVEGTRFTPAKRDSSRSAYRHLLKPRAGGIAFVMDALGPILTEMLDVTIAYPEGGGGFWELACGRIPRIVLEVRRRTLPLRNAAGDYTADEDFRGRFQDWLAKIWAEKDARLGEILGDETTPRR
jgi:1-acyl-sn-glycerol-3-phosphate acyltransferase